MNNSKPDWTKAPEGATHYGPETSLYLEAWYKEVGGRWMYWLVDGGRGWSYTNILPSNVISRPAEWNGTGLPPVGTKCEVRMHSDRWYECTVVAHFEGRAVVVLGNHESACIYAEQLRPIRSPERIAAEKRNREEFEAFWLAPEQAELRASCAQGWAFEVWQASRAALVVELPQGSEPGDFTHPAMVIEIDEIVSAIEAAGVRVKS